MAHPFPGSRPTKPDLPARNTTRASLAWRGLLPQLLVVAVAPLALLILVVTFGSLTLHQNAMRSMVGERDGRAVRAAANALSSQIEARLDEIHSLALLAASAQPQSLPGLLDSTAYLHSSFDHGLAFFDLEGNLLASSEPGFWSGLAAGQRKTIQGLLAKSQPEPAVSDQFNDPTGAGRVVLVAAASPGQDRFAVGAFSPGTLARQVLNEAYILSTATRAWTISADRQILFQSSPAAEGENLLSHPGVAEALAGQSGTLYTRAEGSEHVVAYSPISPLGWGLVIEEPWEEVTSPTLKITQAAPIVLVPVLLLALLALWFGARQVVRPLQELEGEATELAWGNFQAIQRPVGGIAEIRRLQAELVHLAQKVQDAQKGLRGYIGAITDGQEEERRRLARELHDDTLQSLIALKQRVQLLRLADQAEPAVNSLTELESLAESTIENLRRLTRALRPIYLEDLGLSTALEMLAQETGQSIGFTVKFERLGTERRLPPAVELALYRMTQEALSNVARHAQASSVSLSILYEPQDVTLRVEDDGQGFEVPKSPAEFAPGGHFGLLGLYERAELIGARLEIRSAPGGGTCLTVKLKA